MVGVYYSHEKAYHSYGEQTPIKEQGDGSRDERTRFTSECQYGNGTQGLAASTLTPNGSELTIDAPGVSRMSEATSLATQSPATG